MPVRVIPTAPPYASHLEEVATHPAVCGLRLNTVMPLRSGPEEALERLSVLGKPLWVDLKGRQLRVVGAAIPPYTEIRISHPISVETPVDLFLGDGRERARVAAVDGDRLILEEGPRRLIGPGESVNIPHPSLVVHGTLTELDRAYLRAMARGGHRRVMLSYVEEVGDVEEVRSLLPGAELMLKIENSRGLRFARSHGPALGRLVAARGDLYVEVVRPHRILSALRDILAADPEAVVASRLFESLLEHPAPSAPDISDAALLLALGYRTFLLGDAVSFHRDTTLEAISALQAVASEMT